MVEEDFTFEVDESAERAVMNAESPRLMTLPLLVVIVSVDTVLSVHIRPMFAVLGVSPPRITAQSSMEDGSATEAAPPHGTVAALVVCKGKAAAQAYKSKRKGHCQ